MHLWDRRLDNAAQCRAIVSQIKCRDHIQVAFEGFLMVRDERSRGCYLVVVFPNQGYRDIWGEPKLCKDNSNYLRLKKTVKMDII